MACFRFKMSKARELGHDDDQPSTSDPGLDFTVPENTTAVVLPFAIWKVAAVRLLCIAWK